MRAQLTVDARSLSSSPRVKDPRYFYSMPGALSRFFRGFFAEAVPAARRLGLAQEHVAIADRHARVKGAWQSHLEASKAAILEGAGRCSQRRRALVIGAGDCLDVPVSELAERFDELVLVDVVIGREARRKARKHPGKVRTATWDATGALNDLARNRNVIDGAAAVSLFAKSDPGLPPGGEADLIVSANCISQLGLVPGHSLPAMVNDQSLPDRCAKAAGRRHVQWLARRSGVRVLIADLARLDIAADGRELKREALPHHHSLRRPDRQWRWNLAPIPDWSPDFHRVHEVGAWIDE